MSNRSIPAQFGSDVTEKEASESGHLSIRQMGIVLGVPRDEYMAEFHRQRGNTPDGQEFAFVMPRAWVRQGRKRAASTGMTDFRDQIQVLDVVETPDGRWVDRNGAIWTRSGVAGKVPLMSTPGSVTSPPQFDLTVQQVVTLFGPLHHLALKVGGQPTTSTD